MKAVAKPKVFISYTWRPDDPSDPKDEPVARGKMLADRLRAAGLDSRIDQYFLRPVHGFVPPQKRPGDNVEPWVMWAEEQIRDSDFVLLVCTAQYAANVCKSPLGGDLTWEQWHAMPDDWRFKLQEYQMDETTGKKDKVPYVWWDWHFMIQEMESGRVEPQKFIPAGFGPYSFVSRHVPLFIKGASYYNLDSNEDFDGLLRSIRTQFRARHPRKGIFVSYSH
jgi:TIR domain